MWWMMKVNLCCIGSSPRGSQNVQLSFWDMVAADQWVS